MSNFLVFQTGKTDSFMLAVLSPLMLSQSVLSYKPLKTSCICLTNSENELGSALAWISFFFICYSTRGLGF